jgi:single-strand DNA-binding protein
MIKLMYNWRTWQRLRSTRSRRKQAIKFNVAVNQDYKDGDGNKVEKTEWVKAVLWKSGKQSTKVSEYLKKGQKVYIEGIPTSEGFESKDGGLNRYLLSMLKS